MLPDAFCRLADLLQGRRIVALTGAGCSTESGIPDYRGPDGGRRVPSPIRYRDFVGDEEARRRYWARSAVGWPRLAGAAPNPAHEALARLESLGSVRGVITQNVDGLHQGAGSREVLELHGSLDDVRCLDCGAVASRGDVQDRILELNPGWKPGRGRGRVPGAGTAPARPGAGGGAASAVEAAPDGDAAVPEAAARGFRVPSCRRCGGVLKPDVTFFGENVPKPRLEAAWRLFERGDALLVAGSSLAVFSGYRFVLRAAEEGIPVGIVNLGRTRGDAEARVRVEGRVGEVLPALADELARPGMRPGGG